MTEEGSVTRRDLTMIAPSEAFDKSRVSSRANMGGRRGQRIKANDAEEAHASEKLTGVRALETLVQLEGEGNVNLHHLHLRYARRMRYHATATAAEHQVVAVDAKYHHVPAQ